MQIYRSGAEVLEVPTRAMPVFKARRSRSQAGAWTNERRAKSEGLAQLALLLLPNSVYLRILHHPPRRTEQATLVENSESAHSQHPSGAVQSRTHRLNSTRKFCV